MEMMVDFPGGSRVDAHFETFTVHTDQPPHEGGQASSPTPFDTFLASLATCAGYYVMDFCRTRGIDTQGIRLLQRAERDRTTGMIRTIRLEIQLPASFPEKYKPAVVRAAELCKVKRHLEHPPTFEVQTSLSLEGSA
jgi:putative redox protein